MKTKILFSLLLVSLVFSCKNYQAQTYTENIKTEEYTYTFWTKQDLRNYFHSLDYSSSEAKSLEKYIFKNCQRNYSLTNPVQEAFIKSKNTYMVILDEGKIYDSSIYVRKNGKFFLFPDIFNDFSSVYINEVDVSLKYGFYSRDSFVNLLVYFGLVPKDAKKIEKIIFTSDFGDNLILSENVKNIMTKKNYTYSIPFDYYNEVFRILNIRHENDFSTIDLCSLINFLYPHSFSYHYFDNINNIFLSEKSFYYFFGMYNRGRNFAYNSKKQFDSDFSPNRIIYDEAISLYMERNDFKYCLRQKNNNVEVLVYSDNNLYLHCLNF